MFLLKNRTDTELSEANFHARLGRSKTVFLEILIQRKD